MRKFFAVFFAYLLCSSFCAKVDPGKYEKYDPQKFMEKLKAKYPEQPEFIQAVSEVVSTIIDVVNSNPKYLKNKILDRIVEPNVIHTFKVEYELDDGSLAINTGYRVQFNNAIGPYKVRILINIL